MASPRSNGRLARFRRGPCSHFVGCEGTQAPRLLTTKQSKVPIFSGPTRRRTAHFRPAQSRPQYPAGHVAGQSTTNVFVLWESLPITSYPLLRNTTAAATLLSLISPTRPLRRRRRAGLGNGASGGRNQNRIEPAGPVLDGNCSFQPGYSSRGQAANGRAGGTGGKTKQLVRNVGRPSNGAAPAAAPICLRQLPTVPADLNVRQHFPWAAAMPRSTTTNVHPSLKLPGLKNYLAERPPAFFATRRPGKSASRE